MGVVRQQVKRSAGRSGFIGSISFAPHAANWIHLQHVVSRIYMYMYERINVCVYGFMNVCVYGNGLLAPHAATCIYLK